MFTYLLLIFTIVPALELALLIKVGGVIGTVNTIMLIIFTGIWGAALARYQGFTILRNIQNELNAGRMPTEQMIDGLMILVGGIVLLTPGFITDTIGFLLLIPFTRAIIKALVRQYISKMMDSGHIATDRTRLQKPPNDFEDADFR